MQKIKIIVNPFLKKLTIVYVHKGKHTVIVYYKELDEWQFVADELFVIHVHYDQKFIISAYEVVDGEIDYTKQIPVNLNITFQI